MITLDLVELKTYAEIYNLNESYFRRNSEEDMITNEKIQSKIILKNKIIGIDSIVISRDEGWSKISISSKLLHEKYPEMLNKNSIGYAFRNLNKIIEFDFDFVMEDATVSSIDISRDITADEYSMSTYFQDLDLYSIRSNYRVKKFSEEGMEIYGLADSNKHRITFYDKYKELSQPKIINMELLKYFSKEIFKGKMRIEGNVRKLVIIRELFGIEGTNPVFLKDIFNSEKNVLLEYFNLLFPGRGSVTPAYSVMAKNSSFHSIEKELGAREIIKNCNLDSSAVKTYIKAKNKGNPSGSIKYYMDLLWQMKFEKSETGFDSIKEIKEKLKS